MPSIKQIIAEIQLADTLGPNQKVFVVNAVREAEERLKLKAPRAPRKVTNAKGLMLIDEWEKQHGQLGVQVQWIAKNNLDITTVAQLLTEFATEMRAKGKQYADFRAAFMTYLRKGYLSKPYAACVRKDQTNIDRRGVNL